jgi:hypothetical protein
MKFTATPNGRETCYRYEALETIKLNFRERSGTSLKTASRRPSFRIVFTSFTSPLSPVCTENLIRVDEVMESPKLVE